MPRDKAANPELHIGAKIRGDNGVEYTRIARLNRSDWIDTWGRQYAVIPTKTYTPIHEPTKPDYEAGFKMTPILRPNDHGFGIIAGDELQPGDMVWTTGFRKTVIPAVAYTSPVKRFGRWKTFVTSVTGTTIWAPTVCYVARNLGPEPATYQRFDS